WSSDVCSSDLMKASRAIVRRIGQPVAFISCATARIGGVVNRDRLRLKQQPRSAIVRCAARDVIDDVVHYSSPPLDASTCASAKMYATTAPTDVIRPTILTVVSSPAPAKTRALVATPATSAQNLRLLSFCFQLIICYHPF